MTEHSAVVVPNCVHAFHSGMLEGLRCPEDGADTEARGFKTEAEEIAFESGYLLGADIAEGETGTEPRP